MNIINYLSIFPKSTAPHKADRTVIQCDPTRLYCSTVDVLQYSEEISNSNPIKFRKVTKNAKKLHLEQEGSHN